MKTGFTKHRYEAKEDRAFGFVLYKDGNPMSCPFRMPIPQQGAMGQVSLAAIPCSTQCPHAQIVHKPSNEKDEDWVITCGAEKVVFPLEEAKSNLKIIQ